MGVLKNTIIFLTVIYVATTTVILMCVLMILDFAHMTAILVISGIPVRIGVKTRVLITHVIGILDTVQSATMTHQPFAAGKRVF